MLVKSQTISSIAQILKQIINIMQNKFHFYSKYYCEKLVDIFVATIVVKEIFLGIKLSLRYIEI